VAAVLENGWLPSSAPGIYYHSLDKVGVSYAMSKWFARQLAITLSF